jgi:hypothetical protein
LINIDVKCDCFDAHTCNSITPKEMSLVQTEIVTACSDVHTKHKNTRCEQNVEFLDVKPGGKRSNHQALQFILPCTVEALLKYRQTPGFCRFVSRPLIGLAQPNAVGCIAGIAISMPSDLWRGVRQACQLSGGKCSYCSPERWLLSTKLHGVTL